MPQDPAGTSTALMEKRHQDGRIRRDRHSQEVGARALYALISNAIDSGSISKEFGDEILKLAGVSEKPLESGAGAADSPDEGDAAMRSVGEAIGSIYVRIGQVFWDEAAKRFVPQVEPVDPESVHEAFAKLNEALEPDEDGERLPIHSFDSLQYRLGDPPYESDDLQAISEYLTWLSSGDVTFNHHFPDLVDANDHADDPALSE